MVDEADIKWGRYRNFEGPFYRGKHPFVLPSDHSKADEIVAVVTATEGGHYESYNGYDGQDCSFGLIQVIERAYYQVSKLLGYVSEKDLGAIEEFQVKLRRMNLAFKPNSRGRWRFFFGDLRGEVDTGDEQRQFFHLRSTGERGTWDDTSKTHAKRVAAAICSVMESPQAQHTQRMYVSERVLQYAYGNSKAVIGSAPDSDVGRAFVSAYLTFAVNNPVRANKHLALALKKSSSPRWTLDWLIEVLKELTFGPCISIYPHRYNAIRQPLERLYGIDLPDMAEELRHWKKDMGITFGFQPAEVQAALIYLGADLGPMGADGKWGRKSRAAMLNFEESEGLPPEVRDGMPDPVSMERLREVLYRRGYDKLS